MKILISNDDGYQAPGIHALARVMSEFGEVTVVAPKYHQSAMSMAVDLGFKKLAFKELPEEGPGRWAYLDAAPASCVKFGLEYMYPNRDPDLVICGINHGTNAASAANYSATLGATMEGAINGIKSIGVSLCNFKPDADMSEVEKVLPSIIQKLLDLWPDNSYGLLYNINIPDLPADKIKGVRISRQGKAHWIKEFVPWDPETLNSYDHSLVTFGKKAEKPLEEGETAYLMVGEFVDDEPETSLADHRLNEEGWITITPNTIDRTEYGELKRLDMIF